MVMITTSCVDNVSNYSIGTNNVAFGQVAAKTIAAGRGSPCTGRVFMVSKSTPNQVQSYNAFITYAKVHYPNMKVVATELDNGNPSTTETDLTSLPESYPTVNAIWFLEGGTSPRYRPDLARRGRSPASCLCSVSTACRRL